MAISCKLYIEIPVLLITFCFMLSEYVTTNFIIFRTCYVTFEFNISDCKLLGTNNISQEIKDIETQVQPVVSIIMMTKTIMDVSISVLFSLIIGPWSNKHGRKPVLLSTITAYFLGYLTLILFSSLYWISPWWWLGCCLVSILGGGFCSIITVTYCYITDISSEENRGIRMAFIEACLSLGSVVGTISSSYVFEATGYIGIYSICAGFSFISILYLIFFVPESVPIVQQENKVKDFLDVSVIIKTIKTCFKRRQNKDRSILILLITMLVLYIFVIFSADAIFFLYVREKFNWSLRMYTIYSATNSLVDVFGTIFIVYILYKVLKINDMVIVLFEFLSLCIASVIFGIANTNWMIYLGAAIRRLSTGITPLARTAISKIVPPDDLGPVFAFLTSAETIVQIISAPLYTLLYNATISTEPSIFNFVSAAIFGINVVITSAVILIRKSYPNEELRVTE